MFCQQLKILDLLPEIQNFGLMHKSHCGFASYTSKNSKLVQLFYDGAPNHCDTSLDFLFM